MKRALVALLALALGFNVSQSTAVLALDNETPILEAFSISNGAISPGESVTLDYDILEPGGSGLTEVDFYFISPVGQEIKVSATGGPTETGPATFLVPQFAAAGEYVLEWVWIGDAQGNVARYFASGDIVSSPEGAIGPITHTFDFSQSTFTVTNANEDIVGPSISAFALVGTGPFVPGESVTIDFAASDGSGSGFSAVIFTFEDVLGREQQVRVDDADVDLGVASALVDESWSPGPHTLREITLIDVALNVVEYQVGGRISIAPPGITGPSAPHGFDFSTVVFAVDNAAGDISTPVLTSFGLPGSLRYIPGSDLVVDYVASDAGSGLGLVFFEYEDSNLEIYQAIVFGAEAEAGPAVILVDSNWPPGVLTLKQIYLTDEAQISVIYYRDGTVEADPPGAANPGPTHDFPFEDYDITIITSGADASCNGSLGIEDVLYIRMVVAELAEPIAPCGVDMNGDAAVQADDALFVLQILAGMVDDFPPGSR